jgi:hypothetical protein
MVKIPSKIENEKVSHTPLGLTRKQSMDCFFARRERGKMQGKMHVTSEIQYIQVLHEQMKATHLLNESKLTLEQ